MANTYGAAGIYPTPRGQPSIAFDLQAGATRLIPAGTWMVDTGPYTTVQEFDPVQAQWQSPGGDNGGFSGGPQYVNSDGFNYRVANLCGTIVGAFVTTAGSAYTTAPTVTFTNAASAAATAIIGGAVSTTVTVTNGGSGYLWAPIVFLDSPPQGAGYQATASCTISAGAVSTVTINNQGAGYTAVPNLYFINDPRDTVGIGATAVATLTGAQTVTQLIITNQGTANTTLFPTIAFSSGSAAATPIMVRAIGGVSMTTAGSGYSGNVVVTAYGNGWVGSANVLTNPRWTTNLVRNRPATLLLGTATSGGALTGGGASLFDGGIFASSTPYAVISGSPLGLINTGAIAGVASFSWTNPTDTILIQPC
jgi:hypothetical protein